MLVQEINLDLAPFQMQDGFFPSILDNLPQIHTQMKVPSHT